ncbi:hypothetical protein RND81_02G019900 [Saponaria officinalis]|uniref:Uncharacterized protein n=1 Tax=Saponaria officinalis TaxID=3572 RepID=A0AAW1MM44_SAPOF
MPTSFKSPSIISLSLIFVILINLLFTASSFPQDNDPSGWMLIKDEHDEWKFVASRGVNRRNLRSGPPVTGRPSPKTAPSPGMRRHIEFAPPSR